MTDPTAKEDQPLRALMVDDDPLHVQATGNLLMRAGFQVSFALTGAQALELFGRHDFHVAVVDLHLTDVQGVELIRYLRQAPNGVDVRIVAWTASGDAKLLEAALLAGADDVYQKSMPPDVIVAKFQRLASKSNADAKRDTRLLGLELAVNSLMEGQAKLLASVNGLRNDIAPMRSVVTAWEEAHEAKRVMGRLASWVRRFWLWLAAFAASVGAVAALFGWGNAK